MNRKIAILPWAVAVLALGLVAQAGEIIDRVVATVNRHIILLSDWEDAIRYEAFVGGRPLDHVTAEDRKAALDRLIDQELLREQVRAFDSLRASPEEVAKRIEEIRKQYPGAETDPGWRAALAGYGLTDDGLKLRVGEQIELMRLVEARLRPTITIDSNSIESYYNQELLPQLRQSGAQDVPLAEATPQIKELLTQQKVNQLLTGWLQDLRAGSEIRNTAASATSQGQPQ